jgi:riboflavin synthase
MLVNAAVKDFCFLPNKSIAITSPILFWNALMFTGIVETIGIITQIRMADDCLCLTISPQKPLDDIQIGDSVAVNGVCLTVTAIQQTLLHVTVVPETLRLTNLSLLTLNSKVNLERSMQANARIGGHYVQGHIDGMGEITELQLDGQKALLATINLSPAFGNYIVRKGYISIDGMSVTIVNTGPTWFTITLIPYTQATTIVNQYVVGTKINIEVDLIGKYVERILQHQKELSLKQESPTVQ